jgi:serine protease Do
MLRRHLPLSRFLPWGRVLLCLAACLSPGAWPAQAQYAEMPAGRGAVVAKTSPRFLAAFQKVVARPSLSTVRVRCDGKDIALGTVVDADGWVVTKASELTGPPVVRLPDGRQLAARVVGLHEAHDIALLKVEASDLAPVEWRPSKEVPVGYWAVSVGPGGKAVAAGVVSVGMRNLPAPKGGLSGNPSGGGYLGISLEPSDKEARVSWVVPGGGAARAGLKARDTILAVAGKAVSDTEALLKILRDLKPGDEIEVRVKRDEQELKLKAKLGKRPPDRGEMQNNLGSELSKRRVGFPTVLQHDSVVRPVECGGPLVDLDGKAIGINICRAGRTESYAVPTEVLLPLLRDMRAGRYPPRSAGGTQQAASTSH